MLFLKPQWPEMLGFLSNLDTRLASSHLFETEQCFFVWRKDPINKSTFTKLCHFATFALSHTHLTDLSFSRCRYSLYLHLSGS